MIKYTEIRTSKSGHINISPINLAEWCGSNEIKITLEQAQKDALKDDNLDRYIQIKGNIWGYSPKQIGKLLSYDYDELPKSITKKLEYWIDLSTPKNFGRDLYKQVEDLEPDSWFEVNKEEVDLPKQTRPMTFEELVPLVGTPVKTEDMGVTTYSVLKAKDLIKSQRDEILSLRDDLKIYDREVTDFKHCIKEVTKQRKEAEDEVYRLANLIKELQDQRNLYQDRYHRDRVRADNLENDCRELMNEVADLKKLTVWDHIRKALIG